MKLSKNKKLGRSESIVFGHDGNNSLKESYTRLKDNILYFGVDGVKKVIQIESSTSGEAKTTTCANLAVCLGSSGKKVCVLDLDFRKSRLHRSFNLPNTDGLAEYMVDKLDEDQIIKQTEYENVYLIPRGSEIHNASIILTSEKMKGLINHLRSKFDFILFDCPPVLLISDFIHISKFSDGVLFVVAYGTTKKKQVAEAIEQLRKNKVDIIGAVFTFYDPKRTSDYSEYTYYNYYNYSDKK